jgi:hypothetical protein
MQVSPDISPPQVIPSLGGTADASISAIFSRDLGFDWSQNQDLITHIDNRKDLILSCDERAFLAAGVMIPMLRDDGIVVLVVPQMDVLHRFVNIFRQLGISADSFDTATTKAEKRSLWEAMDREAIEVLLVSPGRLASKQFRDRLARRTISIVSVARAESMSPWSHRFIPSYRRVGEYIGSLSGHAKMAHVWSCEPKVANDVRRVMNMAEPSVLPVKNVKSAVPRLESTLITPDLSRVDVLEEFVLKHDCQGVIYASHIKSIYETVSMLEALGERAAIYRPGMDELSLTKVRAGFESGETRIVVSLGPFLSTLEKATGLEFVVFNGMPDSLEFVGHEIFAHEAASPLSCLSIIAEGDFYQHRFAIDKNFPDTVALRSCFNQVKDVFGRHQHLLPRALLAHVKVATHYGPDELELCLDVMLREGLVEHVLDPVSDQIMVRLANDVSLTDFWHEYPQRKLEQVDRLQKVRDFLTSSRDLGKLLKDRLRL